MSTKTHVPSSVWPALACLALTSGCAAAGVTTEVGPDGSWTRTLRFSGDRLDRLKETFVLPRGAPWKTRKDWVDRQAIVTAQRPVRRGELLQQDIVVRGTEKSGTKRLMINEVAVREVAPGRLEYREVLRWQGPRPRALADPGPRVTQELQRALPEGAASEAEVRSAAQAVLRELWRIMFGPGSLVLGETNHEELASRRMRRLLGIAVEKTLREKIGERLTREQRLAAARRWVAVVITLIQEKRDGEVKEKKGLLGAEETSLVPLLFSVWLPGRIVETNGERDEVTGEVFWGLYPDAAASEDVVLTAICELKATSDQRQ